VSESRQQLHMRHDLRGLPPLVVPSGYSLRSHREDDLAAWTSIMVRNAELGDWTEERAAPYFAVSRPTVLDGSYFVTFHDIPVATAQLVLHREDNYAPIPELGWVAAAPEHRGKGIGFAVCLAVLRYAAALGHQSLFLRTDDHRLPAIRSYLRLGFQPWMYESTAPDRWAQILARLNSDEAVRRAGER
jgi:mycothiol synthase